jgi:hypothetical protein
MSKFSTVLYGTLLGGIAGPGVDTTGYLLKMSDLDVDATGIANVAEFFDQPCVVAGLLEPRTSPIRGRVQVLRASHIAPSAKVLLGQSLRASVFLPGTLRTGAPSPGGEGPNVALTSIAPELDVSAVARRNLVGRFVAVTGSFALVDYAARGLEFVFRASELKEAQPGFA